MTPIVRKRIARVALSLARGLGPHRQSLLMKRFGSAQEILAAGAEALAEVKGVGKVLAERVADPDLPARAERALEAAERRGVRGYLPEDEGFPGLLREIADPPLVLWVRGELPRGEVRVAVVGTRRATEYGLRTARRLGAGLARRGICVVSGLALGADGAAHRGALRTGRTAAVTATGLDRVYPGRHRELAGRIEQDGALVSEYPLGTPARPGQFPARNRLISGLCRGTVVVESRRRGGSLITAYLASDQNRELFAVPGRAGDPTAEGPNDLIRRGYAKLVESVDEVIEEIVPMVPDGAIRPAEGTIGAGGPGGVPSHLRGPYEALEAGPLHVDELSRRLEIGVAALLVQLFELEVAGFVRQLAGRQFARR